MTTLADLSLKQLVAAYGLLAEVKVQPKYFNSRATGVRRLEALLADKDLTHADALKVVGIENKAEPEPTAPEPLVEPAPAPEPAASVSEPAAEAPESVPAPGRSIRRDTGRLIAKAMSPLAWLDIEHLAARADDSVVFAVNDTSITVGDVRRARAALGTLPRRGAGFGKPQTGTKQETILALLRRPRGATVAEIADTAGGWLPHSVRGFLAGLKKKGHAVTSEKPEGVAERRYHLSA